MKVILGLGNPGLRFRFSRHNLGFLVVERLAQAKKIKITQRAFNCLLGKGKIENRQLLLAKPSTFVNLSGQAAALLVNQTKIQLKDLLVVCDDVNLPLGKIRIRPGGSDGGHKGLRSIIEALGANGFSRLRIGVGTPQKRTEEGRPHSCKQERGVLSKYVLGRFNRKEIKIINEAAEEALNCCRVWAEEGIATAMNKFNRR